MTRFSRAARLAAAAWLFPLAACGGGPPWTLSQSPSGITLRWYARNAGVADATALARHYCGSMGKTAGLGELQRDGSAAIARYRCG